MELDIPKVSKQGITLSKNRKDLITVRAAGVSAIAAAYLTEETIYINISAFKDLLQGVYD